MSLGLKWDTYRLKVRGWKKVFHANGNKKKARVAILVSDKIDFKMKTVTRDKEVHYIMMKGSIQEEDITIVNIYAPNIGSPKYIKQIVTDIKGDSDSNTIILGDFNSPLTSMDRPSRQKINKETLGLNDTLHQMDSLSLSVYIYMEHSIQKQQNTHSFQVHMEYSPG